MSRHFEFGRRRVSCEVTNGLPTANGKVRGYYVSRRGGRPMLVVECRSGERIRINDTKEFVVLEIHPDQVRIVIECAPENGIVIGSRLMPTGVGLARSHHGGFVTSESS